MMKFLIPLLSLFLGNAKNFFKEPSQALTQQLLLHVRAITQVIVTAIASLALSCVGVSLFINSIAGQLDKNEEFHISGGMIVYLLLSVVASAALVYSLRQKTWLKALDLETPPQQKSAGGGLGKGGALEQAIAVLVLDFVEERQKRRSDSHPSQGTEKK